MAGATKTQRLLSTLCGTFALILVAVPANSAETDLRIRHVSVDRFPKIELVVSSGSGLQAEDLRIEEGGNEVEAVVTALDESGKQVNVVLLIDASGSMLGEPMAAALDAAESFVEDVPSNVRVGVAAFADKARKIAGIGSTQEEAISAINSLSADGETALFDGVRVAASMFRGKAQRNIVLLSDGGDTASTSGLKDAGAAAKEAQATIYSVGLETPETDVASLETLSATTGGRYQPAATADLERVYDDLATEIASQFAITFRSEAASGSDIPIRVTAPSGEDLVTVLAPGTPGQRAGETFTAPPVEVPEPFPSWVFPSVLAACFLAIFFVTLTAVGTRQRRVRETRVRRALHDSVQPGEDVEDDSAAAWLPEMVVNAGGRVASRAGFRESLDRKLEQAVVSLKADEFVGLSLFAMLLGAMVGYVFLDNLFLTAAVALAGAFGPTVWLRITITKRLNKLNDQIPEVVTILSGSLRAGHSFLQALDLAAREVDEPAATEFQRLVTEVRLGRTIDDAMEGMSERVGSEGFSWAVLAVKIQRQVGGNLAELLDTVATTLREREAMKRQIKTLSAEGRLSMYVIGGLPIVIALYMAFVNPDYLDLLFTTQIGKVMIASGAALLVAGFMWMRKVVTIDV